MNIKVHFPTKDMEAIIAPYYTLLYVTAVIHKELMTQVLDVETVIIPGNCRGSGNKQEQERKI